jgi:hypothetical protein
MGARVYSPIHAHFLSIDPVEGGNTSDYAYPADPVNGFDLNGNCQVNLGLFHWGSRRGGCAKPIAQTLRGVAIVAGTAAVVLSGTGLAIAIGTVVVSSLAAVRVDPSCQKKLTAQCEADLWNAAFAVFGGGAMMAARARGASPVMQWFVGFMMTILGLNAGNTPAGPQSSQDDVNDL